MSQVRIFDLIHTVRATLGGKNAPLPWSSEANKRLAVLVGSTIALLVLRVQIMGARLPVFTRYAISDKSFGGQNF